MGHYSVGEVFYARNVIRPAHIPVSRPRGRKAEGVRYERAVAGAFGNGFHGAWFEFHDRNGMHHCQPDVIFGHGGVLWCLEVKYSLVEEGFTQLEQLYLPVLSRAFGKPVKGLQVCKVLRPHSDFAPRPTIVHSIEAGMKMALAGAKRVAWQWSGEAIVGTRLPASPLREAASLDSPRAPRDAAGNDRRL